MNKEEEILARLEHLRRGCMYSFIAMIIVQGIFTMILALK